MSQTVPDNRRLAMKIARIVVGLVILVVILTYVDVGKFLRTLTSISPRLFALILLTALAGRLLRAWKWNRLLRARGVHISTWQALRLSLVSHFTGAWTPGQIGGDAYRVLALRDFGQSNDVVSTVIIERYAGLCAVSFFALITMPITMPYLYIRSPWVLAVVAAAIFLVAGIIPCMFSRRLMRLVSSVVPSFRTSGIGNKLSGFYQTLSDFRRHEATLVVFAIATLLEVLSYFVLNWLAARALALDADLTFFLLAMPIVHLLLRIPISFQALGVQEGCFVYAMVAHGFSPAEGLAVSVLQRALEWLVSIVPGGLLLWLTSGPKPHTSVLDANVTGSVSDEAAAVVSNRTSDA